MKSTIRRRISQARRALDFALGHPINDSGYTAVVNRLKGEVERADTIGMLQDAGIAREHSAVAQRTDVRTAVRSQHLLRLSKLAKLAAKAHPELRGIFDLPRYGGPNRSFQLKAQQMLTDATANKEVLSTLGLGDTFIEELTQAVAEFDGITGKAHAARADHVGAGAELIQLADLFTVELAVLDTFMRHTYANDANTLAAWRSAKNLAGPYTPAKTPPAEPVAPAAPVATQPVATQPAATQPEAAPPSAGSGTAS